MSLKTQYTGTASELGSIIQKEILQKIRRDEVRSRNELVNTYAVSVGVSERDAGKYFSAVCKGDLDGSTIANEKLKGTDAIYALFLVLETSDEIVQMYDDWKKNPQKAYVQESLEITQNTQNNRKLVQQPRLSLERMLVQSFLEEAGVTGDLIFNFWYRR